jgi:hypothetical protein
VPEFIRNGIEQRAWLEVDAVLEGIAAAIDDQDGGLVEPARAERTVCMRQVMRNRNDLRRVSQQAIFAAIFFVSTAHHPEIFILHHERHIVERDPGIIENVLHRQAVISAVVLPASEPFFLNSQHHFAVR